MKSASLYFDCISKVILILGFLCRHIIYSMLFTLVQTDIYLIFEMAE